MTCGTAAPHDPAQKQGGLPASNGAKGQAGISSRRAGLNLNLKSVLRALEQGASKSCRPTGDFEGGIGRGPGDQIFRTVVC